VIQHLTMRRFLLIFTAVLIDEPESSNSDKATRLSALGEQRIQPTAGAPKDKEEQKTQSIEQQHETKDTSQTMILHKPVEVSFR